LPEKSAVVAFSGVLYFIKRHVYYSYYRYKNTQIDSENIFDTTS